MIVMESKLLKKFMRESVYIGLTRKVLVFIKTFLKSLMKIEINKRRSLNIKYITISLLRFSNVH